MPIKTKVMLIFISCVTLVLILSNVFSYFGVEYFLLQSEKREMHNQAFQIHDSLAQQNEANAYVESMLSQKLRTASIVAESELPKDIKDVTNEQLVKLSQQLGVSQISLLVPTQDQTQFVVRKSSEPKELNIKTGTWGFWNTAFQELYSNKSITTSQGISMQNYWSGPLATAYTDQNTDFFGYYHDSTLNYIIDPFLKSEQLSKYITLTGATPILKKYLNPNDEMEIAGLSTQNFGKPIKYTIGSDGVKFVDVPDRPVIFGTYNYKDPKDLGAFQEAVSTKASVLYVSNVNGMKMLKEFNSFSNVGDGQDFVIETARDYRIVQTVLNRYIVYSLGISLLLLLVVVFMSFWLTEYVERPIKKIMERVQNLSKIQFGDAPLSVRRKDEIGELANSVNEMSSMLQEYTSNLQSSLTQERTSAMALLGSISQGIIPELEEPVQQLRSSMKALPELIDTKEDGKLHKIIDHMVMANEHMDKVVQDFSSFVSQGAVDLQVHNMDFVIREAIELVRPTASEHSVTIEYDGPSNPPLAKIDDTKMRQVLINLMKNGAEATTGSKQKIVRILIQIIKHNIVIDVSDTGCGIPEENWATLFTSLTSSKDQGFGFGLMLSNYIVRSNGGTIAVYESSSEGTTMRIVLPQHVETKTNERFERNFIKKWIWFSRKMSV